MVKVSSLVAIALGAFGAGISGAQAPTDGTATDAAASSQAATAEELARLTMATKIAEQRNQLLEARIGKLEAGVAPAGKIDTTDVSIEPTALAYEVGDHLVGQIGASVIQAITSKLADESKLPVRLVIHSDAELQIIEEMRAFGAQVSLMESLARETDPAPPAGCLGPGPSMAIVNAGLLTEIGAAISVLSLFRVDESIKGVSINPNELAVIASLAGQLLVHTKPPAQGSDKKGKPVLKEVVYLPLVNDLTSNGVMATGYYDGLLKLRLGLESGIPAVEAKFATDKPRAEKCGVPGQKWISDMSQFIARKKQLLETVTAALDSLSKASGANSLPRLQLYERARVLEARSRDAWRLFIKPIASGGNVHVRRNVLFSTLKVSAGMVVSYMLFAPDGELVAAGTRRTLARPETLEKLRVGGP